MVLVFWFFWVFLNFLLHGFFLLFFSLFQLPYDFGTHNILWQGIQQLNYALCEKVLPFVCFKPVA